MSETSKINKDAKSLLSHLFYDKIIQLGAEAKHQIGFGKQLQINKLKDEVELFIEHHPYSEVEIRVLEKGTDDNDNYKVSLSFRNYKEKTDKKPGKFLIVIDNAFSMIIYYEWSLNNLLMKL
jgi:hypothetical protein